MPLGCQTWTGWVCVDITDLRAGSNLWPSGPSGSRAHGTMHQAISTILVVPGIFVIQGHPRQSRRITHGQLWT